MYIDGLSSRDVADHKEISKNTVLKWVLEFADKLINISKNSDKT